MDNLEVTLSLVTMTEGILYLYDVDTERYIEITVELETEYDPEEKECLDCPRVEERLELTSVQAPFGQIDLKSINNIDEINGSILEFMHEESIKDQEPP